MPDRTGRRATDARAVVWQDFARLRILLWVVAGICVLSWIGNGITVKVLTDNIRSESTKRVNESCTISESKQRDDVLRLGRTYAYLDNLSVAQRRESINRAVITFLPQSEEEALTDDAPTYCKKRGVGLPPGPGVPCRPRSLPQTDRRIRTCR